MHFCNFLLLIWLDLESQEENVTIPVVEYMSTLHIQSRKDSRKPIVIIIEPKICEEPKVQLEI